MASLLSRLAPLLLLLRATAEEPCKDEHENCASWAGAGECQKNKGFMSTNCPISCSTCPKPIDPKLIELSDERVEMEIEGYGTVVLGE